jgi:hypothetical protein
MSSTPEQVWDSAMQNELDTAFEEKRECADSRYYAAQNLELYADMFGVDIKSCIEYARANYKDFDWARTKGQE